MASYKDLINKSKKDWDCPTLMSSADEVRGGKIPFSSPLMNWCTHGGVPRNAITEFHGAEGGGKSAGIGALFWNGANIEIRNSTLRNIIGGNCSAGSYRYNRILLR